ncbi:DnaJ-domain-containing protein [Metschnikowia bicuspidata var. bicuspidata NRRL YB-4993]|uniref:DnaJ-domain-containing protein n=1 Tax=Metschnikowia bicuspidata var. bicuspidata NRRL YB-4993 TaxID=869754 RepID=A0A1A0H7P8_9ASCO|nr:DnaJ-domain-containing protein [Metschnikowia bicuspidata var. bicuspidata NRRL YB-4993]OBA19917.1 DnaJ-domain-containing protein [Metschnikowia bicuspidata var. bicuspidata NRRL YB-4993]
MVCETQLYDLLMVPATATVDQITKSYKKLALKYHPDKTNHNPESTEKFKDLSRAYEILKDPRQRGIYDVYGTRGLDGSFADAPPQQPGRGFNVNQQPRTPGFGFEQTIFSQLFNDMSSAFGSNGHFGQHFGQPHVPGMNFTAGGPNVNTSSPTTIIRPDIGNGSKKSKKGTSIHHNFKVTLADMYHGKEAKFLLPKMTKCSTCNGMGCFHPKTCVTCEGSGRIIIQVTDHFAQFQEKRDCHSCRGTGIYSRTEDLCDRCDQGYRMETKLLKVSIPPGSKNGDKCILLGQSDEGKNLTPGDVIIHLEEQPHPFLVRQGNDLFMEYDIDLKTALLGGRLVILDFPRMGEDVILYVNVHGKKRLNDSIHPLVNSGEVIGTINLGIPKLVKGLGMPINETIKNGKFYQSNGSKFKRDVASYKRGDLYIKFNVQLPEIKDFAGEDDLEVLQNILPGKPTEESFGTVAWEHHLSSIPELEPIAAESEIKSSSGDERASSEEYDYEQIEVDSQDGSEEQEDDQFYAEKWSKELDGKRRKVDA